MSIKDSRGPDVNLEVNLRSCAEAILRRKQIVVWTVVILVALAIIYSFLAPKVFKVETVIQVGHLSDQPIEPANQVAEKVIRDTYGPAIRQKLNLPTTQFPELLVKNPDKTSLVRVAVESEKTERAQAILTELNSLIIQEHTEFLNEEKDLLQQEIKRLEGQQGLFQSALERALTITPASLDRVLVIDSLEARLTNLSNRIFSFKKDLARLESTKVIKQPEVFEEPVKPRPLFNIALAIVLGLLFGVFLALLGEWWQNNM